MHRRARSWQRLMTGPETSALGKDFIRQSNFGGWPIGDRTANFSKVFSASSGEFATILR